MKKPKKVNFVRIEAFTACPRIAFICKIQLSFHGLFQNNVLLITSLIVVCVKSTYSAIFFMFHMKKSQILPLTRISAHSL